MTLNNLIHLPIGIYTFFGVPGSGKTTIAAAVVKKCLKKHIPVYSNVPLLGAFKVSKSDIGSFQFPLFNSDRCILVWDECGIDFDARNYKGNFKDFQVAWWKLHRHYRTTVLLFSQGYDDMDKKLRTLTKQFYLVKMDHIFNVIKAYPINFDIGINEMTGEIQSMYSFDGPWLKHFTCLRIFAPLYWKIFDSYDAPSLPDLKLEKYENVHEVFNEEPSFIEPSFNSNASQS